MGPHMPDDHRPWPRPRSPWMMRMQWANLLFAHWEVPVAALRDAIPAALDVDTYEGRAWLGIVPFWMRGTRPRCVPSLPGVSNFPELNVRTYVTVGGKPGVWFFSLDAASKLAVRVARKTFHLPYFDARMPASCDATGTCHYESTRTHRGATPATFRATYGPTGSPYLSQPGTLEHWLTERYALYAMSPRGVLHRGEIHHVPWPLQPAQAVIEVNTMAEAAGFALPNEAPRLHYVEFLDVIAWRPRRV